jgi:hypothetical protein
MGPQAMAGLTRALTWRIQPASPSTSVRRAAMLAAAWPRAAAVRLRSVRGRAVRVSAAASHRAAASAPEQRPRLILLRHGASESETNLQARPARGRQTPATRNPDVRCSSAKQDHQRPLTEEGRVAVAQLAARLRDAGCLPQIILCRCAVSLFQRLVSRLSRPAACIAPVSRPRAP